MTWENFVRLVKGLGWSFYRHRKVLCPLRITEWQNYNSHRVSNQYHHFLTLLQTPLEKEFLYLKLYVPPEYPDPFIVRSYFCPNTDIRHSEIHQLLSDIPRTYLFIILVPRIIWSWCSVRGKSLGNNKAVQSISLLMFPQERLNLETSFLFKKLPRMPSCTPHVRAIRV